MPQGRTAQPIVLQTMSHIPLDLRRVPRISAVMETEPPNHPSALTTTQIGAVGEALIAAGLTIASKGRLSPFKPFADDDGLDLLLFDKVLKKSTPVQIKCRTKVDDERAQTVQFDIRLKTFAREGCGVVLCALLDGLSIKSIWLFEATQLQTLARVTPEKLTIVASVKATSRDKFQPCRCDTLATVVDKIISLTPNS